jgi:hypothetical protein
MSLKALLIGLAIYAVFAIMYFLFVNLIDPNAISVGNSVAPGALTGSGDFGIFSQLLVYSPLLAILLVVVMVARK